MRLNLGAGGSPLEGYDNSWDNHEGKVAYPLNLPGACADEVRASHLLEHFGWQASGDVLKEWIRVLKPGGLLKIAVPDLEVIADKYRRGEAGQFRGWVYGGQVDKLDVHLAGFDFDSLNALMRDCGLVGIHMWPGDEDSSGLEVSLNLAGYKRPANWPTTISVISRPRLGFSEHADDALEALLPLNISRIARGGAYWGKALEDGIETAIESGSEYVLTMDYDSLFKQSDVEDLLAFMLMNEEADALVAVEMGRIDDKILMNPKEAAYAAGGIKRSELEASYYPIKTGHFGLTLFRTRAFAAMKKPWFFPTYKEDGSRQYDDDINFWISFEQAGQRAFLTPRVVIGHAELVALWPDRKLKTIHQRMSDYRQQGKPRDVWR